MSLIKIVGSLLALSAVFVALACGGSRTYAFAPAEGSTFKKAESAFATSLDIDKSGPWNCVITRAAVDCGNGYVTVSVRPTGSKTVRVEMHGLMNREWESPAETILDGRLAIR